MIVFQIQINALLKSWKPGMLIIQSLRNHCQGEKKVKQAKEKAKVKKTAGSQRQRVQSDRSSASVVSPVLDFDFKGKGLSDIPLRDVWQTLQSFNSSICPWLWLLPWSLVLLSQECSKNILLSANMLWKNKNSQIDVSNLFPDERPKTGCSMRRELLSVNNAEISCLLFCVRWAVQETGAHLGLHLSPAVKIPVTASTAPQNWPV